VPGSAQLSTFIDIATLDPGADLADLDFMADLVGDARVVAIGESAHYCHEFYALRHRLARYLVERLGFSALAFESGFSEARLVDEWIGGGAGQLADAQTAGFTYLFGSCAEMGDQLSWLRGWNSGRERPVHWYGIDLPGSCGSLLPSLRAVERYLAEVDPVFVPRLARLHKLASAYVAADPRCDSETRQALRAYCALPQADRDEQTGQLADLGARFDAVRLDYIRQAGPAPYDLARQHVRVARQLDTWLRDNATAAAGEHPFFDVNIRDASMADTVGWILQREERLVILAHNLHIQRTPYGLSWLSEAGSSRPASSLGHHLSASLGNQYLVIGTTFDHGEVIGVESAASDVAGWNVTDVIRQLEPADPGSIDGLLAAEHPRAGLLDLRGLMAADAAMLASARPMRSLDQYVDVTALAAFDALVHVPQISLWTSAATSLVLQDSSIQRLE
jgi:erythromycin esterase